MSFEVKFTAKEHNEFLCISNALNLDDNTKRLSIVLYNQYKERTKLRVITHFKNLTIFKGNRNKIPGYDELSNPNRVKIANSNNSKRGKDPRHRASIYLDHPPFKNHRVRISAFEKLQFQSIEEFIYVLKDFIRTINLDMEVEREIELLTQKFSFLLKIYTKYEKIFNKLDVRVMKKRHGDLLNLRGDQAFMLKNFGWLIFIDANKEILHGKAEVVETTYLLATILNFIVQNKPSSITIGVFENNKVDPFEHIFSLFKMQDKDLFTSMNKQLFRRLKELIDLGILKKGREGIMDGKVFTQNYHMMHNYYQKHFNLNSIDERYFMHEKKRVYTPSKFTPFQRQGQANNRISFYRQLKKNKNEMKFKFHNVKKRTMQSQRMLNYEVSDNISMKSNFREIVRYRQSFELTIHQKFPKKIMQSPYMAKGMTSATPMTTAMEMYNWLYDSLKKIQRKQQTGTLKQNLDRFFQNIDTNFKKKILKQVDHIAQQAIRAEGVQRTESPSLKQAFENKHRLIISLFYRVLEQLLLQEEKRSESGEFLQVLSNESFYKSLIACSIETVFFVLNVSTIKFEQLLQICGIQAFEFWRILNSFIGFDRHIPFPIKRHLFDIEQQILRTLAWKKDSIVHQIIKTCITDSLEEIKEHSSDSDNSQTHQENNSFLANRKKKMKKKSPLLMKKKKKRLHIELSAPKEEFFKRVLQFVASQISMLSQSFKLPERVQEGIWQTFKYILIANPEMFIERYLDQIFLCCFYSTCKVFQKYINKDRGSEKKIKFQEIINKYQELNAQNKKIFVKIIYHVNLDYGKRGDVIQFYNYVYIKKAKQFILSLIGKKPNPLVQKLALQTSPQNEANQLISDKILKSPLSQMLKQQNQLNPCMYSKGRKKYRQPQPIGILTPNTQTLFAFSPNIKNDNLRRPMQSKKVINFDIEANLGRNENFFKKAKKYGKGKMMEKIAEETDKKYKSGKNLFGGNGNGFQQKSNQLSKIFENQRKNGFKQSKGAKFLNFAETTSQEGRERLFGSNTPDFKNKPKKKQRKKILFH